MLSYPIIVLSLLFPLVFCLVPWFCLRPVFVGVVVVVVVVVVFLLLCCLSSCVYFSLLFVLLILLLLRLLLFLPLLFLGLFCIVQMSYFTNLVFNTMMLLGALAAAFAVSVHRPSLRPLCAKGAVYLVLFAYPLVAVKVVEAFGCHDIDGIAYLRADYSVQCYTQEWTLMVAYASVFLVMYVKHPNIHTCMHAHTVFYSEQHYDVSPLSSSFLLQVCRRCAFGGACHTVSTRLAV